MSPNQDTPPQGKATFSVTETAKRYNAARDLVKIAKTGGAFGGKTKTQRKQQRTDREKKYLFA